MKQPSDIRNFQMGVIGNFVIDIGNIVTVIGNFGIFHLNHLLPLWKCYRQL